jgi:hypothetical protein
MNASSFSRFRKGAVFNPKHAAPRVAMMGKATRQFGRFAMRGSFKVRTFTAQQRSPLFRFGFLGSNFSEASLANLFFGFGRANVMSVKPGVALGQMFFGSKTFKIFDSVVSFVTVDVMDLLVGVKRLQPALRHNSMHQTLSAEHQVPVIVLGWSVGKEISENFSAARDSVKVVKESVLDSVYGYANHVVPQKVTKEFLF